MRRQRPLAAAVVAVAALSTSACTAGTGNDPVIPDQSALTKATNDALALLEESTSHGFGTRPIASGHDRTDDKGREVSQAVTGRALFQIVCSGQGKITVTMPRQQVSKLVSCGQPASGFPFRGPLSALVVGQRDSNGAYAWRILPAT